MPPPLTFVKDVDVHGVVRFACSVYLIQHINDSVIECATALSPAAITCAAAVATFGDSMCRS